MTITILIFSQSKIAVYDDVTFIEILLNAAHTGWSSVYRSHNHVPLWVQMYYERKQILKNIHVLRKKKNKLMWLSSKETKWPRDLRLVNI